MQKLSLFGFCYVVCRQMFTFYTLYKMVVVLDVEIQVFLNINFMHGAYNSIGTETI